MAAAVVLSVFAGARASSRPRCSWPDRSRLFLHLRPSRLGIRFVPGAPGLWIECSLRDEIVERMPIIYPAAKFRCANSASQIFAFKSLSSVRFCAWSELAKVNAIGIPQNIERVISSPLRRVPRVTERA